MPIAAAFLFRYATLCRRCFCCRVCCCFLCLCFTHNSFAQTDDASAGLVTYPGIFPDSASKLFISTITISGNKHTKRYIVLREMNFKAGDSIPANQLFEKLQQSRELVYNTTLFTDVLIEPYFENATNVNIQVLVKEKWYIYPTPRFQLVDPSVNEWIKRYNADLERVVYGLKFTHYNLSGRRDQLRIFLLNGFARNFSVNYSAPYSNNKLTEGFSFGAGFAQNREIIYKTDVHNNPLRYRALSFVRNSIHANGAYLRRKGYYRRHLFSIGFAYQKVDDSIRTTYSPAYFNNNKNEAFNVDLGYTFQYINTNNINYPLTGKVYGIAVLKRGAGFSEGLDMLSVDLDYNRFLSLGSNWYNIIQAHARMKLASNLAYVNQRAFGYGEYHLRGLENYVIDAVHSMIATYTIKKKIISFKIKVPVKNKIVPYVPFTFFAKAFGDAGYAYNRKPFETRLNNRLLYSGGFGIDILSLYDINLRVEYSFNQLGQKGLFLHTRGGF